MDLNKLEQEILEWVDHPDSKGGEKKLDALVDRLSQEFFESLSDQIASAMTLAELSKCRKILAFLKGDRVQNLFEQKFSKEKDWRHLLGEKQLEKGLEERAETLKKELKQAVKRISPHFFQAEEICSYIENHAAFWSDKPQFYQAPPELFCLEGVQIREGGTIYLWSRSMAEKLKKEGLEEWQLVPEQKIGIFDYDRGSWLNKREELDCLRERIEQEKRGYQLEKLKAPDPKASSQGVKNPGNFCYLISSCQRLAASIQRDRALESKLLEAGDREFAALIRLLIGAVNRLRSGETIEEGYLKELASCLTCLGIEEPMRKQDATEFLSLLDARLQQRGVTLELFNSYSPVSSSELSDSSSFKNIFEESEKLLKEPIASYKIGSPIEAAALTLPIYRRSGVQEAIDERFTEEERSGVVCLLLQGEELVDSFSEKEWDQMGYAALHPEELKELFPGVSFRIAKRASQRQVPSALPDRLEINIAPSGELNPDVEITRPALKIEIPLREEKEVKKAQFELSDILVRKIAVGGWLGSLTASLFSEWGRHYVYYKRTGEDSWVEFDDDKVKTLTTSSMLEAVGPFGYSYLYEKSKEPNS